MVRADLVGGERWRSTGGASESAPLDDPMATRIARATPPDAVVARLDDEAHCVALAVRDDVDAMLRAEMIVRAFGEPLLTMAGSWSICVNVGVAFRPPGASRSTVGLLREARTALVQARRLGPGCALLFDPSVPHVPTSSSCHRHRPGRPA